MGEVSEITSLESKKIWGISFDPKIFSSGTCYPLTTNNESFLQVKVKQLNPSERESKFKIMSLKCMPVFMENNMHEKIENLFCKSSGLQFNCFRREFSKSTLNPQNN